MKRIRTTFDHVAINVKNIQESIAWYSENLSAMPIYQDDTWALLSIGESKVALVSGDIHPPHIAFKIEDAKMFPKTSKIKNHRDGSKYVYIDDLDGNTIEIVMFPPEQVR